MIRKCIIIIIPQVTKEINTISNFNAISTVLNKWPVNGDWEEIIHDKKGIIYIKNGNRYQANWLNEDRIEREDVDNFISEEKIDFSGLVDIELGHITKWTPQEWLENNGYIFEEIFGI